MRNKLSRKCVKGQKIGDSLILLENGNLQPIYPDTFYNRFVEAYWMLKRIGNTWKILKFLKC